MGLGRHVCQKTTILHRRMVSTFYYSTAAALIFYGGEGGYSPSSDLSTLTVSQ